MNIFIKTTQEKPEFSEGGLIIYGEIAIGDFKEGFITPIGYWSLSDYKEQWKEGLERIKQQNTSCLVTAVQDPRGEPLIDVWILYKINKKNHIQNKLYIGEGYKRIIGSKIFSPKSCYNFITPRRTHSEGYEISEWVVDFDKD